MKQKPAKTEKPCKPLNPEQMKTLACMLISQTERQHYGTNRKRRITAPAGAVMLF